MDDLALADDQSIFHHVAPATLRRGDLEVALAAVQMQRGAVEPLPDSAGKAFLETRWFSFPRLDAAFAPATGDRMEESPERDWTIGKVEVRGGGSRFRCQGVRTMFASGASVELEVQTAVLSQDDSGAAVRTWQVVGTLTAAIVHGRDRLAEEHGQTRPRGDVDVLFLASPIPLSAGMRLVEGGSTYAVLAVEPPKELAGAWRAAAAAAHWPRPER